jgi:GGDEF domain-containing protein
VIAQKVLATLEKSFELNGQEFFIGGSIGISLYPIDGNDADSLLKHADIAMYQSKASGGNAYRFYSA